MLSLEKLKSLPHAEQAEQAVLGGLILDNQSWDNIADVLTSQDFYQEANQTIFAAIHTLANKQQAFDAVILAEHLKNTEQLEPIGGLNYLAELTESSSGSANIKSYAYIIRERALLRRLIQTANQIAEQAYDTKGRPARELVDWAEQTIFKIAEQPSQQQGPRHIGDLSAGVIDRLDILFKSDTHITGTATGYKDLDNITNGLQDADLIVVAGRPSMGKTSFAMNLVENMLIKSDKGVLVFSMEMPAESLVIRMLASIARVDQGHIRSGKFQDQDWNKIMSTIKLIEDKPLFIDESESLGPGEVRARARRIAKQLHRTQQALGLIVVDYMQLMHIPGSTENRATEISEISRSLKGLAKELNVPVIVLSQLNRSLENRPDKRPIMADIRESGAIEQDADLIMFIYRDEVYHEDSNDKGTAEIILGKHRNGPVGTIKLAFLKQFTRFEDLSHEGYGSFVTSMH